MFETVVARESRRRSATVRRRGKRWLLAAAGGVLAAGLAWFGAAWWRDGRFVQVTDDAYVGGNVSSIAPHVAGFVEQVLVGDNQPVRAGQALVRLDARDFQAALSHAAAVVAARDAALGGLRAQYPLQQATIRQDEAELAAKAATAAFAAADAERYRKLAVTAAGSRQSAQKALSLDQEARSSIAAAAARLEAARQQLKVLEAQVAEAAAATAQARSDLETARLNLGYTVIHAPVDGYVANRAAEAGAYVNAGGYLISVIPSRGLWVDANFKEDQLARIRSGARASVTADVLPDHVFKGHVDSLAHGTGAVFSIIPPENATGNFTKIVQRVPVRIVLDPDDAELFLLRPGLSTTVRIDTRDAAGLRVSRAGPAYARSDAAAGPAQGADATRLAATELAATGPDATPAAVAASTEPAAATRAGPADATRTPAAGPARAVPDDASSDASWGAAAPGLLPDGAAGAAAR